MRQRSSVTTTVILALISLGVLPWANGTGLSRPLVRTANGGSSSDRQQAADLLNGRQVVLRLYPDWKIDPKAYLTLSVPLEGLDVTFDAVRLAYTQNKSGNAGESLDLSDETKNTLDQELKNATVVVMPAEQQDAEITPVLNDCIVGKPYLSGQRFRLWPGDIPPIQLYPHLFLDALQQPIPNAEVEVLLADNSDYVYASRKVWIANAKLDGNGRMQPPRTSSASSIRCILFVVVHPDCGPVPAKWNYALPKPGADALCTVAALPKDRWCVFLDALGNPIPGALVEVFDGWRWESRPLPALASTPLDERGRLRPPQARPLLEDCCFLVSDPNYGMGIVEPYDQAYRRLETPLTTCVVPLVAVGTRADERSIWGTVVDANEHPVGGAVIRCSRVSAPGRASLRAFLPGAYLSSKCVKVPTDKDGRFSMHVPLADQNGTLGRPVPPNALYNVGVETPKEFDLQPYTASLAAGQEHLITLKPNTKGPKTFVGTLIFEDEFGPVTDPNKLQQVILAIRTPQPDGSYGSISYGPGGWINQKELAFGIYSATATWGSKYYIFGPVEVTSESPEVITFKPQAIQAADTIFRGRVIHGITHQPLAEALVLLKPWPPGGVPLLDLAPEDMEQLEHFGPEIDPEGELSRVLEQQTNLRITHTDPTGRYEIAIPTAWIPTESLIAIKKDFLGAEQQLRFWVSGIDTSGQRRFEDFKADRTGRVPLPDMKLFPAGTIIVEPNVPALEPGYTERIEFLYRTTLGDSTPWLKDFWATPQETKGGSVFHKDELAENRLQSVYVPADVELTLRISRLREEFAPVLIEGVKLQQGQVLDLGRVEFPPALRVVVKVIDSAGKPLEGINVVYFNDRDQRRSQGAVTDSEGIVQVWVAPNSYGRLAVEYRNQDTQSTVRAEIPYRVGGQEDAGREFLLPLSDEFLAQLLQAGQSR